MRYLIFTAAYHSSCIKDEFEGDIQYSDLALPGNLIALIDQWNSEYSKIIIMDEEERTKNRHLIEKLDEEGLKIVKLIISSLTEGEKIKYYSEGRLMYLPT